MNRWKNLISKDRISNTVRKTWPIICFYFLVILGIIIVSIFSFFKNLDNSTIYSFETIISVDNKIEKSESGTQFDYEGEQRDDIVEMTYALLETNDLRKEMDAVLKENGFTKRTNENFLISGEGKIIILSISGENPEKDVFLLNKTVDLLVEELNNILINTQIRVVEYASEDIYQIISSDVNIYAMLIKMMFLIVLATCIYLLTIFIYMLFDSIIYSSQEVYLNTGISLIGLLGNTDEYNRALTNLQEIICANSITSFIICSQVNKRLDVLDRVCKEIELKNNNISVLNYTGYMEFEGLYKHENVLFVFSKGDSNRKRIEDLLIECKLLNRNIIGFLFMK